MEIKFHFIGWNNTVDPKTGSKHDKVWTAFEIEGSFYAGWGARGKKMSFKNHGTLKSWETEMPSSLRTVMNQKKNATAKDKHYEEVDSFKLFTIFPYFEDEVSGQLLMKTLTNQIM